MSAARSRPVLQASALLLALFAITLDFLQPLAHAASMRNGEPGVLWPVLCRAASADPDRSETGGDSTPVPARSAGIHACCLGLAHAPPLIPPSADFISLPPIETALAPPLPAAQRPSIAIRDGPPRPRGPPSLPTI